MQNLSSQKISKFSLSLLLTTTLIVLAGCGSGTPSGTTSTSGTGAGSVTNTTLAPTPTLTLLLTDPNTNLPVTSVSSGSPARVNATLKDAAGVAVQNAVVTFSTSTLATMTPLNGTALTDPLGVASITLTGGSTSGATTISASAQVGSAAVNGSIGYAVGTTSVTIAPLEFGVNPLSAFGTTSVTATVTGGGSGSQAVNFTSVCAGQIPAKAFLSTNIATVSGVAVASYRDNGCASTDTITATVSGGLATRSATLTVTPPTTGSIQYISSTPTNISLAGTGGTEVSQVIFKVLDSGNNPVSGKNVTFALSTTLGGITLIPASAVATSDANGLVVTNVRAGVQNTSVRVIATTSGAASAVLSTQSSELTITTGIPDQWGFSLAATQHNIEGWSVDGTTTVLTVSMADHFGNPPNSTAVAFRAEGGRAVGNCSTVNGTCSTTYTSGGSRPASSVNGFGRVTVLATALGEETFTDVNSSGWADLNSGTLPVNEMYDNDYVSSDLPEAWLDTNENGIYDIGETFLSYNNDAVYDVADGQFSGVLCNTGTSSTGTCSPNKNIHIRQSQVIVLSSSFANIFINAAKVSATATAAVTADTTSSSNTLSNVSVTSGVLTVGQMLSGTGIPAGTTITSLPSSTTIGMSVPATAAASSVAVTAQYPPAATVTADTASGSNTLTNVSVSAGVLAAGQILIGSGIPAGTGIRSASSSSIVMNAPATATAAAITVKAIDSHIDLPACNTVSGNVPLTFLVTVVDVNGNAMPVGSTVAFSTSNGTITSAASYIVPDTIACRTGYTGCPATAASATFGDIPVTMKSDATFTPTGTPPCSNSTPSGTFTVKVTSPGGVPTTATANLTD